MPSRKNLARLALVYTLVACALGCSRLPSQPQVERVSGSESALLGVVGGVVNQLVSVTVDIVGRLGGTVANGRWKVAVPPNAIDGSAAVSVRVADSNSAECQLEISPASKNGFRVPVTVTIDCRNVPASELKDYVIYWSDPVARRWVEVPGSKVDLTAKTVSAPLSHFSNYSAGPKGGKAGW